MSFELFLARKIHFKKKSDDRQVTPPAVRIAIIGIALGLALLILSVAIVVGFKKEVRNQIIGFGSHIQISKFERNTSYESSPIAVSDTFMKMLSSYPGIRHVAVYATKPGILKTEEAFQGIVLKGIDEQYDQSFYQSHLVEGEVLSFDSTAISREVLMSRTLAEMLGLRCGDDFYSYFVQQDVRARKFHICGIYETGNADYDRHFLLVDIRQIRRLNGWDEDDAGGVELLVDEYSQIDQLAEQLFFQLIDKHDRRGEIYFVRSIKELNPMIFEWLSVLDINVAAILVLIIAVSGFTMISGLLIIILERTSMIGVLKALGQSNGSLRRLFLYVAFFLISRGMLWGNLIGLALCFLQSHFRLLKLDPASYYINAVPIDMNVSTWLLINIVTCIVSLLIMLIPSCLVSKISPAQTIRFE